MFSNKRVLTVDDSPTIRTFLHGLLSLHGAQVEEAGSGREALEMLAKGKYDLVLLDLLLPDVDGIQVLRGLRERDGETAVVMLTGMGGIKSANTAVSRGAAVLQFRIDLLQLTGQLQVGHHVRVEAAALEQALEHRAGLVAQKQLQEVKADFYSMVTHDLRNPTSAVWLSLQLLTDESTGPLNADQRELIELAQGASQKLLSLINDYLDFAKIDAGYLRLDRSETNLCAIVEESARLTGAGQSDLERHQVHARRGSSWRAVADGKRHGRLSCL